MTKPKHTSGPWKAHLNVLAAAIEGHIVKANHGAETPIASLWKGGGTHGVETQKANALLIAAAPDLLAACEFALKYHRMKIEQGEYSFPAQLVTALKSAIASAKNEG